jgi:hypothetical protein
VATGSILPSPRENQLSPDVHEVAGGLLETSSFAALVPFLSLLHKRCRCILLLEMALGSVWIGVAYFSQSKLSLNELLWCQTDDLRYLIGLCRIWLLLVEDEVRIMKMIIRSDTSQKKDHPIFIKYVYICLRDGRG